MSFLPIDYGDLALGALLIVANGLLSLVFDLKLIKPLFIAATRMVVQLLLVGLILTWLFEHASALFTSAIALIMLLFAGREVMARQERSLKGLWSYGLGAGAMAAAAVTVTALALTTQIRPQPWYAPQIAIPLLGMILGNAMNGISLGLNIFTAQAEQSKAAIEARLALGATKQEAFSDLTRRSLVTGFMPIINSMSATGLVFLPGMMTGQILAGIAPQEAVKYQILVMFLIAGATGLGVVLVVLGALFRLSDERHRLRLDRLTPRIE